MVKRALHPDLKLVVHPGWVDMETARRNYAALEALLSDYYAKNKPASR